MDKLAINVRQCTSDSYMNGMYIESNGTYPLDPKGMYRFTYQVYTDWDSK
jgi:hypothetical protein